MNATTTKTSERTQALLAVLFMAVLGGGLMFAAGHAQSATLHDTAHDMRHATGFPCH
jgi:cobalt transporter subunit CbtB